MSTNPDPQFVKNFEKIFGRKPDFFVSAPGRVNLIGEHVDHQGYSVLPCAINQQTMCLCATEPLSAAGHFLHVEHVDDARYPKKVFEKLEDVTIKNHSWSNYLVAGLFGISEFFIHGNRPSEVGYNIDPSKGFTPLDIQMSRQNIPTSPLNFKMKILVSGNVPQAAGLSSSSSLVVMAAMCFLRVGNGAIDKNSMAELCANCERYVGTAGGGMDQAAIILSEPGTAQFISFNPVKARKVQLPPDAAFVVANTGRLAPKAVQAAKMYNMRVFELKCAAYMFLKELDKEYADTMTGEELVQLQWKNLIDRYEHGDTIEGINTVNKIITKDSYNKKEIQELLGQQRLDILLKKRVGEDVWTVNEQFYLKQRVVHVLTEAKRVEDFVSVCSNTSIASMDQLKALGNLLNQSGNSLGDDGFSCSCEEIDELTSLAIKAGAFGSRLTGAGWGGCTVSIVHKDKLDQLIETLRRKYYDVKIKNPDTTDPLCLSASAGPDYSDYVFAVVPAGGAFVTNL